MYSEAMACFRVTRSKSAASSFDKIICSNRAEFLVRLRMRAVVANFDIALPWGVLNHFESKGFVDTIALRKYRRTYNSRLTLAPYYSLDDQPTANALKVSSRRSQRFPSEWTNSSCISNSSYPSSFFRNTENGPKIMASSYSRDLKFKADLGGMKGVGVFITPYRSIISLSHRRMVRANPFPVQSWPKPAAALRAAGFMGGCALLVACTGVDSKGSASVLGNTPVIEEKTTESALITSGPAVAAPARDGNIAILEEFDAAVIKNTIEALELFVLRHADHPLAKEAKQRISRLKGRAIAK